MRIAKIDVYVQTDVSNTVADKVLSVADSHLTNTHAMLH